MEIIVSEGSHNICHNLGLKLDYLSTWFTARKKKKEAERLLLLGILPSLAMLD